MNILVANLGSTSFKYRLFQEKGGALEVVAKGGYERVEDFGPVIDDCLQVLVSDGHLSAIDQLDAVGFKTVLGKDLTGCLEADDAVLEALEGFREVAPAHNPPYAAAIRLFRDKLPGTVRVALFETAFYQWMPEAATRYAVPHSWYEAGIRRYGFHGASHKFIAERSAELLGREDIANLAANLYVSGFEEPAGKPLRVISCHLGGSSSVCGILNGRSIGASMGFSPQGGLPQNNRVGDLDSGALGYMLKTSGLELAELERQLTKEGGLLGLSGVSNDMRDIKEAAEGGNARAKLALDLLVHEIRRWIGAYTFQMGGCDALVFTAGIGENNPWLRSAVCEGLEELGFSLDASANEGLREEGEISSAQAKVRTFVIPANEEQVIAREVMRFLQARKATC